MTPRERGERWGELAREGEGPTVGRPGCSAAWLARLTGGQKVGGSNPPTPIAEPCWLSTPLERLLHTRGVTNTSDELLDGLPASLRGEYQSRLRSRKPRVRDAAHVELWYKHQLELGGLQCKPPERTSRGTTPDWHLHVGDVFVAAVECKTVFPSDEIEGGRDRLFRWLRDAQAKLRNKKIQISIRDFTLNDKRDPNARRFAKFLDDRAALSLNIITEPRPSYLGDYQYTDKHGSTLRFGLYVSHDPLPIGTPLFRVVNLGAR